jgi:hypothetical protein
MISREPVTVGRGRPHHLIERAPELSPKLILICHYGNQELFSIDACQIGQRQLTMPFALRELRPHLRISSSGLSPKEISVIFVRAVFACG